MTPHQPSTPPLCYPSHLLKPTAPSVFLPHFTEAGSLCSKTHSGLSSQGMTPSAQSHEPASRFLRVELGPNATAVVTLETIYSLKLYNASASLSPWSSVASVAGCYRCNPQMWEVAAVLERHMHASSKGPAIFVCCYILFV